MFKKRKILLSTDKSFFGTDTDKRRLKNVDLEITVAHAFPLFVKTYLQSQKMILKNRSRSQKIALNSWKSKKQMVLSNWIGEDHRGLKSTPAITEA